MTSKILLLDVIAFLELLDLFFILAVTICMSARNYPAFYWMNLSELFLTNINNSSVEIESRVPAPMLEVMLKEHGVKSEMSESCNLSSISLRSDQEMVLVNPGSRKELGDNQFV